MEGRETLEETIRQEGNLLIGESDAGMQMFDDTMKLALDKTVKTGYLARTVVSSIATAVLAGLAYKFDNIYLAATSGAIATIAVQQGIHAVDACKKYAKTLDEAISHKWGSEEQIRQINYRYL